MTIPDIISIIESRRKDAERIRLEIATAERQLRESIRERMAYNSLTFAIVCRRMEVQMHTLTNFFCNGQSLSAEKLAKLLDAIKRRATIAEKA